MPFLAFILGNWKLVLFGILLLAIGVQTWRLDHCRESYDTFKTSVEALGRAQEMENKRIAQQREKATKEALDGKDKAFKDLTDKYANARRMLNNPRSGPVPTLSQAAAPSLSSCQDPELDRRLGEVERGVLEVIERGDQEIAKYRLLWQWATETP